MLKLLGADVVGMSTASEVIVARRCGLRVLGLSVVTNMTVKDASSDFVDITHESVLKVGKTVGEKLQPFVKDVIKNLKLINNEETQNTQMDVSPKTLSETKSSTENNSVNNDATNNNVNDGSGSIDASNTAKTKNSANTEPLVNETQ